MTFPFNRVPEVLAKTIRLRKRKAIRKGMEEVKFSLFSDNMVLDVENPRLDQHTARTNQHNQ